MHTALRFLALTLAVGGVYYVAATVEILLAHPDPRRHTVWWPAGWAVAAVLVCGPRAAVGVFVGEWLGVLTNERAAPWWLGGVTGVANGLEALAGAWALRRAGATVPLDTVRAVVVLTAAAVLCPLALLPIQLSATWVAGWFHESGAAGAAAAAAHWWANDCVAVLFVVPLVLAARDRQGARAELRGRQWEPIALTIALVVVTAVSFGAPSAHWFAALAAAAFPFLAWAGLRFGPRVLALELTLYASVIIVLAARRLDPFADLGQNTFPFLHLLFAVTGVTGLLLAATVAERGAAEARAAEALRWEELGVLAGGLAHDLNNRLTAVLGNADLAATEVPADSPAAQRLAAVATEAERLARLARDLLAYTGRGLFTNPRPTDVGAAVRDAVAELGLRDRVAVTAPPGLVVVLDPALLRLAVRNLLANATEAANGTGGGAAVAVTTELVPGDRAARARPIAGRSGPHARVRVSDSGRGMPPDVRHRMFDPFFSTKGAGRGLGLAAVLGAVRAAGGFVHVESEPDRGTTVDLFFPLAGPLG